MIESAAYELIKKEGFEEGLKQGLLEEAREMVLEVLEERFGLLPPSIVSKVKNIQQREVLKSLHRAAIRVKDLEEFKTLLKRIEE